MAAVRCRARRRRTDVRRGLRLFRVRCTRGLDLEWLTWSLIAVAGAGTGAASGLVPSLHSNTLVALTLAIGPSAGEAVALFLVAAAGAHALVAILPATYLGAPGEETAFTVLPAHRMLMEGRGPSAVRIAARSSIAATLCALALVLPYKWLLLEPGRLLDAVAAWMPWILVAVLVILSLRDLRRGWRAWLAGVAVMAASGTLGVLSGRVPVQAMFPVPATPLLPLLTGLFGAATLVESLRSHRPVPVQTRDEAGPTSALAVWLGVGAAAATSVLPGLTSSVATALARAGSRSDEPRHVIATQAAVSSAHAVFSLTLLWLSLRARTGLAAGLQGTMHVNAWAVGAAPPELRWVLLTLLAGVLLGWACLRLLDGGAARWIPRLPQRGLTAATLTLIVGLVAVLSGWQGLLLFAASLLVGLLPGALGTGRVHLTACLLVPVLAYHWGFM